MIVLRRKQFAFSNFLSAFTGISKQARAGVMAQRQSWANRLIEEQGMNAQEAMKQAANKYKLTRDMTLSQQAGAAAKGLGNTALLAGGTALGAGALGVGAVNSMNGGVGKAVTGGMGDENSHGY